MSVFGGGSREDFPDMTVRLSSCLECDGIRSEQTVCSFMRGLLSGVFSTIAGHVVHCGEPLCTAKGDSSCESALHSARNFITR